MFKFTDLSDKDEEFKAKDYLLTSKQFFKKRRTNKKIIFLISEIKNRLKFLIVQGLTTSHSSNLKTQYTRCPFLVKLCFMELMI